MPVIREGSWMRSTDRVTFKIGQRVRGWSQKNMIGDNRWALHGIIKAFHVGTPGEHRPTMDTVGVTITRLNLTDKAGYRIGATNEVWAEGMEALSVPLDVCKPLSCRDPAIKVFSVRASGHPARPIGAQIVLQDGRELDLTYPDHGQFYEGFDQPIDLIGESANV